MTHLIFALLLQAPVVADPAAAADAAKPAARVVPAGTVIPVNLTSRISTKHANEGDGIYAQTAVPIVVNNEIVIPAGSFVRGRIAHVKQPGRIKGRAEMTFSFQNITLPTGASFEIFASLGGTGGTIERKGEATVVRDKGDDGEEILTDSARGAGTGAAVGVVYGRGVGGAAKGAAAGAAAGAAGSALAALIRRGDALVLEPGTMIEIVLDRPIER
jgi:hypothetical protein